MLEFNWGFVFTIINLLVLYALLKKFLFGPVNKIIAQREKLVQEQLSGAKEKERKALAMKEQYEATLAGADREAEKILIQAKQRAKADYEELVAEAEVDKKRMVKEAKREIAAERDRSMRQMKAEIAGLAVSVAEKAVSRQQGNFDENMMNAFLREEGAMDE